MTSIGIEYEPGEIVRRGNMTYEADCWGKLHPVSQSKQYQTRRDRLIKAQMQEDIAKNWAFQEELERIRQNREVLPTGIIKVVA